MPPLPDSRHIVPSPSPLAPLPMYSLTPDRYTSPMADPFTHCDDAHLAPSAGSLPPPILCTACGAPVQDRSLVCPACRGFVFQRPLEQLAAQAQQLEFTDASQAALIWQRCLPLLPDGCPQHQAIARHSRALALSPVASVSVYGRPPTTAKPPSARGYYAPGAIRPPAAPETVASVLMKTGGSMLLSMEFIYYQQHSWPWAAGFVLLLLVHEMGHTLANWHYGIRQSPPIFLGYFGAVIFLKEMPRNARIESVIGIAGPIFGTLGAVAVMLWGLYARSELAMDLALWGFALNLFNLLPLPPLDGGRAVVAITPWLWIVGLLGMAGLVAVTLISGFNHQQISWWGVLIAFYILRSAWPRVRLTLGSNLSQQPYFQIGWPSRLVLGTAYFALIFILVGLILFIVYARPGPFM